MSSEFWSAIAGAIIGGGIAALVQWLAIEHAATETNRATAYSLLFKVSQIYSHLHGLRQHVEMALNDASDDEMASPWALLEGLSNSPGRVFFAVDEAALVLKLKGTKVLNDLLALDEKHNATFDSFKFYSDKRAELMDAITPVRMKGRRGEAYIPPVLMPKVAALNGLVASTREYLAEDEAHALDVLRQLAELFREKLQVEFAALSKP